MRRKRYVAISLSVVTAAIQMMGGMTMAEATTEGVAAESILGVVETNYGKAQGVTGNLYSDITIFKGVPYAAPPVGNLRWASPEDPDNWEGVRVFDTYADAPEQWANDMAADPWKTDFYYEEMPNFSEDCLYLNITTPSQTGDENYPVYVWFHGGGLNHGFSYEVECDPEALAEKGVVVVEVGTRLGVFGYMALPQLDEESGYGASGNYGVMDSIKAVEWVKENIKGFGGNPDNITIGGQSGGCAKTAAFFAGDKADGLVKNVIWESGLKYDMAFTTMEDAEAKSIEWLKSCGLTGNETLEEMRAMDASVFMGKEENYGNAPQSMVYDNEYIKYKNLKEAYEDGKFKGVNILDGTNLGEGTDTGINGDTMETADDFYSYYKDILGDLYDEYDFGNLVKVNNDNANATARILTTFGIYTRDSRNLLLAEMLGQKYDEVNENGNFYVYLFSHFTPGRNEDVYWAWHSSELWYVFGSLRDIPEQRDWTDWDHELSDICTSYWTNFMKNGDPNGEGLAEWKPCTADQIAYMNLGEEDDLQCYEDNTTQLKDLLGDQVSDYDKLEKLMETYCYRNYGL